MSLTRELLGALGRAVIADRRCPDLTPGAVLAHGFVDQRIEFAARQRHIIARVFSAVTGEGQFRSAARRPQILWPWADAHGRWPSHPAACGRTGDASPVRRRPCDRRRADAHAYR